MNRERLTDAAPSWLVMETFPEAMKLAQLSLWIEAIMDAIERDHAEPDTWEALYLSYSLGALVGGQYAAALKFGGMSLADPVKHLAPRIRSDGPRSVDMADLRAALALIRAQPRAE